MMTLADDITKVIQTGTFICLNFQTRLAIFSTVKTINAGYNASSMGDKIKAIPLNSKVETKNDNITEHSKV